MTEFKFIVANGRTTVECDGSIAEIANEVGHLANTIFSAYMNQSPMEGIAFKAMVMALCGNEDSPVWSRRKSQEDDIEIIEQTNEEGTVS